MSRYTMTITDVVNLLPEQQQQNNHATHRWGEYDNYCSACNCKSWHQWAYLPCGYEPPAHVAPQA